MPCPCQTFYYQVFFVVVVLSQDIQTAVQLSGKFIKNKQFVLVLLGWTLGQADIQQIECILLPRLLEAHGMC